MPQANTIQTNFTAGEISPIMRGRVDLQKYQDAASTLENWIVKPQGGLMGRPGTKFICQTNAFTGGLLSTRLEPFEFSDVQSYIIAISAGSISILKNDVVLLSGGIPIVVVVPYQQTDLPNLQFTQSADILYISCPNFPIGQFERFSDTNWVYTAYVNEDGPYMDQNTTDTNVTLTGYVDTALLTSTNNDFASGSVGKYVEYLAPTSAGNLVIAKISAFIDSKHVTVIPQDNCLAPVDPTSTLVYAAPNLTASEAIWSNANIGNYVRDYSGAWYLINGFTTTAVVTVAPPVTMQATTGILALTNRVIAATVTSSSAIFTIATDVGRLMRFNLLAQQIWGTLTAIASTTVGTITLDSSIPPNPLDPTKFLAGAQTTLWRLGAWSNTTGYPSCVTFFGERFVAAASPTQPQTFWMSVDGDYTNHSPTTSTSQVLDDNAINATIASNKVNAITWISGGMTLVIGTVGAEWQVSASTQADAVTPTNITVAQQSQFGSRRIQPIRVGTTLLYVQRSGIKVMEQAYDFYTALLKSRDITTLSEHMLRRGGKAIYMAYQNSRNGILWVVLSDGSLAACTLNKDLDIYAWHHHTLGGVNAKVESIACIHDSIGDIEDLLYMVVSRTINAVTVRTIERLSLEYDPTGPQDKNGYNYLDCATIYSGASTVNLPTNPTLSGETMSIVADGAVRPSVVLSNSGNGVLASAASYISMGYGYSSTLVTLPPEGGSPSGTSQGKTKRVQKVQVRVYNSMGFKYGSPSTETSQALDSYDFRSTTSKMDMSPDLKTEDIVLTPAQSYNLDGGLQIVRDEPYPLNILAVMPMFNTYE